MSQPNTDRSPPPAKTKSGCGRTILKGLLILIVVGAAAGIFIWQKKEAERRANREADYLGELAQPQGIALGAVQESEEVKAELGDPIEMKGERGKLRREATGELKASNEFSFDVSGPKADAVVDAIARRDAGNWKISQIKVKLNSGKTIDVPPPSADAPPVIDFEPP